MLTRRQFLQTTAATTLAVSHAQPASAKPKAKQKTALTNEVGITTSSLSGHLVARPAKGRFTLIELPKILREELDMRVIDLNTSSFASYKPAYLDKIRKAADKAGCVLTNLKLNQRGLDMNSADKAVREKALKEYERSIDAASHLGLKWARPLPLKKRPDMKIHVASYRRLCDYAAKRNVRMLVENFGWMEDDPDSVPKLIKAIGRVAAPDGCAATPESRAAPDGCAATPESRAAPDGCAATPEYRVACSPDTGNWKSEAIRYKGLEKAFPFAVTCDFKARALGPKGEHKLWNLKRCFTIGWKSGFRGPWCLEHANRDRKALFRELALLRDRIRKWQTDAVGG